MKAKIIAAKLKQLNIKVSSFTEGDDEVDGEVIVTPMIHVQVATYGRGLNVVHEDNDGFFKFYQNRTSLNDIVIDIRDAMGMVSSKDEVTQ